MSRAPSVGFADSSPVNGGASPAAVILPCEAGEGDRAKRGGGGKRGVDGRRPDREVGKEEARTAAGRTGK